jgi:hypothetical protein
MSTHNSSLLIAVSLLISSVQAQNASPSADQIQNWQAPPYWQPPPAPETPVHDSKGRYSMDATVAPPASVMKPLAMFVAMSPCRVVDTRSGSLPFGAPSFAAGEIRMIPMAASPTCAVPPDAVAYSLNIAVVPLGTIMRWLTAWNTGATQPNASTLNDKAGLVTSNSAVVPAGTGGSINIFVTDPTNVMIDINGYYAAPATLLGNGGTAASPALAFGDTTTGLYSDSSSTVSIATGGINRMTVRADGDLELPGSIRKNGEVFLQNLGNENIAFGPSSLISNTTGQMNTAVGANALLVNTTGGSNTSIGAATMEYNTGGVCNTALGTYALFMNTIGSGNTATGMLALTSNTSGPDNTATGWEAMQHNTSGGYNVAVGYRALQYLTTGNYNIVLGSDAASNTVSGSYNIVIGHPGAEESNTIRIGWPGNQSRTFIAGIYGSVTGLPAIPVGIDANGQLGTISSSRRVKREIHDMRDTSATILNLHPVEFRYKTHGPDSPLQYGLIAEEVAEIAPDLVARNNDGEIETVYYDKVNAMLLNHVQKLTREKDALADTVRSLESRLAALEEKAK